MLDTVSQAIRAKERLWIGKGEQVERILSQRKHPLQTNARIDKNDCPPVQGQMLHIRAGWVIALYQSIDPLLKGFNNMRAGRSFRRWSEQTRRSRRFHS